MDPRPTHVLDLFPAPESDNLVSLPLDDGPFRPIVSASDVLDVIRGLDGEDEETGFLWGEEYVSSLTLDSADPSSSEPLEETWSAEERKKLLGRATNELLLSYFVKAHGPNWHELEPEILVENLVASGALPDAAGLGRITMLHALCQPPLGKCRFYSDPYTFRFAAVTLSGRPSRADDPVLPSPLEMLLAVKALQSVRAGGFTPEVKGFMAACCIEDGLWCLPLQLSIAQEKVYRIAESLGLDIGPDRVAEIQRRVAAEYAGDESVPEVPETEDDAQCLRVIDLIQRYDLANTRADGQVDRFLQRGMRYYGGDETPQDDRAQPT